MSVRSCAPAVKVLPFLIVRWARISTLEAANAHRTGPRGDNAPVNWLFRNRETGDITIGQTPNPPLWVFLGATLVRVLFHPHGGIGTAVMVVWTGALAIWAGEEIVWGVNPFRRILGAVVLAAI